MDPSNKVSVTQFKNLHVNKNVFIMASGPSLKGIDLEPLSRRIVIGLNRSPLLFADTHYNCVMDERLFEEYGDLL